jgi:hypothetical protein
MVPVPHANTLHRDGAMCPSKVLKFPYLYSHSKYEQEGIEVIVDISMEAVDVTDVEASPPRVHIIIEDLVIISVPRHHPRHVFADL